MVWVILSSCGRSNQPTSYLSEVLAIPELSEQAVPERVWPDLSLRKLFEVPVEAEISLHAPRAVKADARGFFYVVDFLELKVQGFGPNGTHRATYGQGIGEGPGEFTQIMDFGVTRDSVVYVNDRNARKLSRFSMDGSFLGSESLMRQFGEFGVMGAIRYSVSSQGRKYTMFMTGDVLFESRMGEEVTDFGPPLGAEDVSGDVMQASILMGTMTPWHEQLIYVPLNFPVIVQYNPDGTLAYARATPDFGQVELPGVETDRSAGMEIHRPTGGKIHGNVSVFSDRVFVRVSNKSKPGHDLYDVYDVQNGDYEFSFETPTGYDVYVMNGQFYQVQDTSVAVWAIDGLTERLAQAEL